MFYSGFCLHGEERLFDEYLPMFGEYVAGFSYGSIAALRHAIEDESVKNLILLSPAYYCHKDEAFKKAQIRAFLTDPALYKIKLLKKSGLKEEDGNRYASDGNVEELRELLYFDWRTAGLELLSQRGVRIEVFIGGADRVVEPKASREFFEKRAKTHWLENKNHILR